MRKFLQYFLSGFLVSLALVVLIINLLWIADVEVPYEFVLFHLGIIVPILVTMSYIYAYFQSKE